MLSKKYLAGFLAMLFLSQSALANPLQCVKDVAYNIILKTPKIGEKLYNDQTAIIWFPRTKVWYLTHTEMMSQKEIFESFQGRAIIYDFNQLKAKVRLSPRYSDRGIVVFHLNVTKEEAKLLDDWSRANLIPEGHKDFNMTCISGTCEAYKKSIGLNIPFPFNTVPSLNAIYLNFLKTIKHPRIARVEYIGQSTLKKNLVSSGFMSEVGLSTAVVAAAGYFTVWAVCGNEYQNCKTELDPQDEKGLEDSESIIEDDEGNKLKVRQYHIPVVVEHN